MCRTPSSIVATMPGFSLTFPPDPVWVRTCRETVRTSTLTFKHPELTELAALLTSEATTNAITACMVNGCAQPITICGEWLPAGMFRIHVHDAAPGVPAVCHPSDHSDHGRGMYLIAELAARHGTCLDGPGPGKSFWFQLEGWLG
ncbi:ATP-binding protein [Streptomyces gobiensis]|uniref:ATP-binding protein n=1 Tax=Streptomyces gobiensis TaxID=2875706 RepID=UPI001E45A460|nr:ATP-binding protein [Streptomyces gobiensis]UGY93047.1 ATP-binding protein [Streptomyces gobiensis]